MARPPLALHAVVTTADGTRYRWDAQQAPGSRPQGLTHRTKLGEGFSDASLSLARRTDFDYPDLELVNGIELLGEDGSVAYEGRIEGMPRELGDSHSISVQCAGWMAHAKDQKFSEIYVDREIGGWGPMSTRRRANLLGANWTFTADPSTKAGPTSENALTTGFNGAWTSPYKPDAEAWYDAGPEARIGQIVYSWYREGQVSNADGNWGWGVIASTDDIHTASHGTGNLNAAGPSINNTFTTNAGNYRHATLYLQYAATPAGVDGIEWGIAWHRLAVYGKHGLTAYKYAENTPGGILASDAIRNICDRWCPQLDSSGVQSTGYPIPQLVFKRAFPFDAFLEINKYHLWHLGVWENRKLHFRPYDLTDYQWEVRTDDPGTSFSWQGQSTESLWNGINVIYKDVLTGIENVLTPDAHPAELRDGNSANPWNRAGIPHYDDLELSTPTTAAGALQLGRAKLAANNTPKAPGTITVKGHIRDRRGTWQQAWKVRAGDTIAITNHPNDRPRLIHETSWDDNDKTLTISVEGPAQAMDALFDRVQTAIAAQNLAGG